MRIFGNIKGMKNGTHSQFYLPKSCCDSSLRDSKCINMRFLPSDSTLITPQVIWNEPFAWHLNDSLIPFFCIFQGCRERIYHFWESNTASLQLIGYAIVSSEGITLVLMLLMLCALRKQKGYRSVPISVLRVWFATTLLICYSITQLSYVIFMTIKEW